MSLFPASGLRMTAMLLLVWSVQSMAQVMPQTLLSARQLQEDLVVLQAAVRNIHPDPAHSAEVGQVARALRHLEDRLNKPMSRDAAWRELATLNPLFADGHWFVGYADWRADAAAHREAGGVLFPFEVVVGNDGEVIVTATLGGGATPFAGIRIASINGVDIRTVTARLLARVHGDTSTFRAELLSRRWWFYYWKVFGAPADFRLGTEGSAQTHQVAGSAAIPAMLIGEEDFAKQFQFEIRPGGSAVLTINTFSWADKPRFFAFTRQAFARMRESGVRRLVIDVRANGGGDDDMWMQGILPYIATQPWRWGSGYRKKVIPGRVGEGEIVGSVVAGEIERWTQPELAHPLRFSGETYVLIGRATYSSAILFANVVQDFGFGRLAGTGGSARAEQSGGIQRTLLPNTGLVVWLPRFILARPSGVRLPVLLQPDLPIVEDPLWPGAAVDVLLQRTD